MILISSKISKIPLKLALCGPNSTDLISPSKFTGNYEKKFIFESLTLKRLRVLVNPQKTNS